MREVCARKRALSSNFSNFEIGLDKFIIPYITTSHVKFLSSLLRVLRGEMADYQSVRFAIQRLRVRFQVITILTPGRVSLTLS